MPERAYRLELPSGPFGTVIADPPWRLGTGGAKRRLHYDTMPTEDIAAIPVSSSVSPDAHLWLWTTNPHLPEALEVVKAWGFQYKSLLTWDKELMGIGWWLRSQTEHCIFAVKSNKRRVTPGSIRTLLRERRRKHSQKPDGLLKIVKQLSPAPYLYLFAREPIEGVTTMISDAPPVGDPFGQG